MAFRNTYSIDKNFVLDILLRSGETKQFVSKNVSKNYLRIGSPPYYICYLSYGNNKMNCLVGYILAASLTHSSTLSLDGALRFLKLPFHPVSIVLSSFTPMF